VRLRFEVIGKDTSWLMAVAPKSRAPRGSAPRLLRDAEREVFTERGYRATSREIADWTGCRTKCQRHVS
jgi:hypothetical protein